ncbi:hypothetical protein Dsin_013254 [Dipteronia sinensis]|uniref:Reverse transcriptase n=1 Tax=Dipteronia sinensis TaxID=43782 RepID=A0AAE0AKW1_9ROSI|nr:hypothetical protein Dsin_013254 [Dipteronia sinensis]
MIVEGINRTLPVQTIRHLNSDFTSEEIRRAVFEMGPLKAQGNDGFPVAFYQKFWGTIGKDVTNVYLEVLNKGRWMDDFNSTEITLIPKVQKPITMGDYMPISLCNVLYKGDPLSKYMFLICAEGLSNLIQGAQERGEITGFKSSRYGLIISHFFFSEDSMLFTRADVKNCETIKRVLRIYSEASGQIVNFNKLAICVSPSVDKEESKNLAMMVGWGEKLLSVGGKEILIKAIVQAIPSYSMSIFRLSKSLFDEIQRLNARSGVVEMAGCIMGRNVSDRKRIGFGSIIRDADGRVMACCSQGGHSDFRYGSILVSIVNLVSTSRNVVFKCVSKKANMVAQGLAIEAMGISEDVFWMKDTPMLGLVLLAFSGVDLSAWFSSSHLWPEFLGFLLKRKKERKEA